MGKQERGKELLSSAGNRLSALLVLSSAECQDH